MKQDTIIALASGPGPAGVSVIRLSGPGAHPFISLLTGRNLPAMRQAYLRTLKHPTAGTLLDKALVIGFKGPKSFTGEDVAEIHAHGGQAVVKSILSAALETGDIRLAEPGEYTRRAFENGKLDLTEAEGLNDLIQAQTMAQQHLALRQLDGDLRTLYQDWRQRLLTHLSYLEAEIEFPDEDLPADLTAALGKPLTALSGEICQHLADGRAGQMIRDGYRLALVGLPNVGKSSLMNILAQRDVAIVSDIAGTTRDSIEVTLDIEGYQVRLFDLAGIRKSKDKVEKEGVRRAIERAEDSDHCLVLVPAGEGVPDQLKQYLATGTLVRTKSDLFHVKQRQSSDDTALFISTLTGEGIDSLLETIKSIIAKDMTTREGPVLTRFRHRQALSDVEAHLNRAIEMLAMDEVLAAEDLRLATRALGSLTGQVSIEDRLDIIFRDFCIGK